ncbi:MAG: helix-turn-helix domain-containing protein [Rhodospirillales bacterium]|jgi:DNA-binding XRE family transcriptional regulator
MPRPNKLSTNTPYAVDSAIKDLGKRLKTARLRRNMSISDLAARMGVDRHLISDAEGGKVMTGIAVYVGMLWVMNLLPQIDRVGSPELDAEGLALSALNDPKRARARQMIDNDF